MADAAEDLMRAAAAGDLKGVRSALAAGADVNSRQSASEKRRASKPESFELLFIRGVNVRLGRLIEALNAPSAPKQTYHPNMIRDLSLSKTATDNHANAARWLRL
jgi:hypothetical protein